MKSFLLFAISMLYSQFSLAQGFGDFDKVVIKTHKISDTIYMLEGQGGNIGVSIGDDGVFIIDDQFGPLNEKITAAIAKLSDKPVNFVVNSHWHFDHSDGNVAFCTAGAIIVSQSNSRDRMMSEQTLSAFGYKQAPYEKVGLPKITFDDEMWFHYNDDAIQLMHFGAAHTNGDTITYFNKANVMHTGDVFVTSGLPFIDAGNGGSITGVINSVTKAMSLINDTTVVIPGHGQLANKADMQKYKETLIAIRDKVAKEKTAGKALKDIDAEALMAEFPKGFLPPEGFVAVVYQDI